MRKIDVTQLAYDVTERFESTIDRQINERATSYEKGTKWRKRYERVTKMLRNKLRSYEKGTKLRKRYESVMKRLRNKLPSYEKGTKLRKGTKGLQRWYEITKKVRSYEKGTKRLRNKLPMSPTLSKSILVIRLTGTVSEPIPFWGWEQKKKRQCFWYIYYRTTLSLNLWRQVYCDVIDECGFTHIL